MFGLHNLEPLCGTDGIHRELTRRPFLDNGRVCATNGHAILFVRDPKIVAETSAEGPPLHAIDAIPWIKKELVVPLAELRSFLRRDPARIVVCRDGQRCELARIYGVPIDLALLRRYLPGGFGRVALARAKNIDWHPHVKGPKALRVRGDGWELIVMALVGSKPRSSFPDAAKGRAA